MLNYCDNVSSRKVFSNSRKLESTKAEIICSGNWNLTNITSPLVRESQNPKDFVYECNSDSDFSESGKSKFVNDLLKSFCI